LTSLVQSNARTVSLSRERMRDLETCKKISARCSVSRKLRKAFVLLTSWGPSNLTLSFTSSEIDDWARKLPGFTSCSRTESAR
jgi:hypothetical protein